MHSVAITLHALKAELAAGREVAFSVPLHNPRDGERQFVDGIWMPVSGTFAGGHAMLMVGYNDSRQAFIVKNSWGLNSAGRAEPSGADQDGDGFIEVSYDWVPHISEAYSVLETRDPASWQNQQVLLGRWQAEFDTSVQRADLAAYHIPGAFPASALSGQTDRRIGTLYSDDAGTFRVNGSFTVTSNRRELHASFGTDAINNSYDVTAGGYDIDAYVFSHDPDTMAGWVKDPDGATTPFYASLQDYPTMTPARAGAVSVTASDYLGQWRFSDDGVEGVRPL